MTKRELERNLNFSGPVFNRALLELTTAELQKDITKRYSLRTLRDIRETIPSVVPQDRSPGTDIPTINKEGNQSTDNRQTQEKPIQSIDMPTTDKEAA